MKEIVVISGKGGTGKTSITASLAVLGDKDVVLADCDVDAADMHLLLDPDFEHKEKFYSGKIAEIIQDDCIKCGKCKDVCRFDAVPVINEKYVIDELNCEGCEYCAYVCPTNAIVMNDNLAGDFYISKTRLNNTLVHAKLAIAADNSGKLVTKVRTEAKKIAEENDIPYLIVDGSPGIGCPVVASVTGSNLVVIVTEPTVSGLHDMSRVAELIRKFGIKSVCLINKADLNTDITIQIKKFLDKYEIPLIAEIPYDLVFADAILAGKTVVEYSNGEVSRIIRDSWKRILEFVDL